MFHLTDTYIRKVHIVTADSTAVCMGMIHKQDGSINVSFIVSVALG